MRPIKVEQHEEKLSRFKVFGGLFTLGQMDNENQINCLPNERDKQFRESEPST